MTDIKMTAEIEVDIKRLDSVIEEHLSSSSAMLRDILNDDGNRACEASGSNGHMCQKCGKYYKTKDTLQSHNLFKHSEANIEIQCALCDKKYSSLLSLEKHRHYMHRYQHRCKACYRTFATPELLGNHAKYCSMAKSPCPSCSKVYDSRVALRNHIKYKHPETKNNWCQLCRRSFTSERGLVNHMSIIHPPGATNCSWCERAFTSVMALHSHVLYKHTDGARCKHCHKVFATKRGLQNHMAKIHQGPDYLCGVCVNGFSTFEDLIDHIVNTHNEDKNEQENLSVQ